MATAVALGRGRARALPGALGRLLTPDVALAGGVAAVLCALAFYAKGGVALESQTYSQVLLILGGAAAAAAALAAPTRHATLRRFHGGLALAGLAALTALTALSIVWSITPADSWLDANRMLAWLAAFAAGLALARLVPGRWAAFLGGIALACVVISAGALLTKVLPEALAENELFARLRAPFDYWNSVGITAAMGVPPLVWLAARRSGHAAVNALAWPALGLLLVCLMLAYSRGALLALAAGLVLWFAVVPLRLRSALALLSASAAAGLVTAWAFAQDGLTQDRLPLHVRSDAGHELGVLVALMAVVLLAGGLVAGFVGAYRPPGERARRIAGRALAGLLAAGALASVGALAAAEGGISGQVSRAYDRLTDPAAAAPSNTPDRLTATSSVRARYWREALDIHAASPWVGAGAASYGAARKRYRTGTLAVQHAHGYPVQTLAELGWAGLAVSLAAVGAWLVAALGATGLRRRDIRLPWDAERVGLVALLTVAVVFGLHSAIDWTWYVPANAVTALLAAGWLAGRGPLRERLEQPDEVVHSHRHLGLRARLLAWRPDPYRTLAAAGVLIVAVTAAWTVVQPLRAVHAGDAAIDRLRRGAHDVAAGIARIGIRRNPLSVDPLFELAAIEAAAGRPDRAEAALERAVRLQPANAEAWRRLGRFRLSQGDARDAVAPLRAAYYLDPQSPDSTSDLLHARRTLAAAP